MNQVMENRIKLIALAVFSLSILLSFDSIVRPSYAQLTFATNYDFTLAGQNNQCDKMKGQVNHIYFCIPSPSTNSDSGTVMWFDSNRNPPVTHTHVIFPQQGGCEPINNPCNANTGASSTATIDKTGQSGKLAGVWCGATDCFTLWDSNDSYSNQLIRFTPASNDVTGYQNITSSTELRPLLTGVDIVTGGIGAGNVYYISCPSVCGSSSLGTLVRTGITGFMGTTGSVTTNQFFKGSSSSAQGWGISSMDICWFCDDDTGNDTNNKLILITSRQGTTTNRALTIIRGDLMTELCGASNNGGGFTSSQNTAINRFLNGTRWIYATDDSIYTINRTTCAKVVTTTYATLGLMNYITAISTNTSQGVSNDFDPVDGIGMHSYGRAFWIQHGSANTLSTLTQINATSFNTKINFDSSTGSSITTYITGNNPFNSLTADIYALTLLRTDATTRAQIIYMVGFTQGGGNPTAPPGQQGGIDCSLPENANILICRLGGNSTTVGVGGIIRDGFLDLGCNIIFVDCSNPDPRVNGLGLLLFIGTIFVIVGMFYYTIGRDAFNIPLFIWIVIIIALSAFFTLTGLIDPVFLILSIVAIVALAAPKVVSVFRGSTFGGGSSA